MISVATTPRSAVRVIDVGNLPAADDRAGWSRWLRVAEIDVCLAMARPLLHLGARLMAKRAAIALFDLEGSAVELEVDALGEPGTRPQVGLRRGACEVSLSHTARHAGAMAVASPAWPVACGFDLLDMARWELAVRRGGDALVDWIASRPERTADRDDGAGSAGRSGPRFALKECVVKALGGLPQGGGFHDIAVTFESVENPAVRCTGAVARVMHEARLVVVEASVSAVAPGVLCATVVMSAAERS